MKHLTETQQKIYDTLEQGGYIKGYGPDLVRVMTADHSPVINAPKNDLECLKRWGAIKQDGMKYIFNTPPQPAMKKYAE